MSDSPAPISPFETIRHQDDQGEYWSARELSALLDYTEWRNFEKVVKKAMQACEGSGNAVSDHFVDVNKLITMGKGGKRKINDYHLSRYACYLVVQNADPEKEIVATGQTYFAIRTRRDELATQRQQIEELRSRIRERDKLKRYHKALYAAARGAGVLEPEDFATFENHGYQGLYNGETRATIATRKGLDEDANISDHMGTLEAAANGFRAALATEMLKTGNVQGIDNANVTHFSAGSMVRETIIKAGVPTPEQLPNVPHIREARRELKRQEQIESEDKIGLWSMLAEQSEEQE